MKRRLLRMVALVVVIGLTAACAVSRSYKRGNAAARAGDWDTAVAHFRKAQQDDPDRAEYRIALERAMLEAATLHRMQARLLDQKGDLERALTEYRKVLEYDPGDRQSMMRAADIERTLRDRAEAARPKPKIEAMREEARRKTTPPLLSPTSRAPIDVKFTTATVREVLDFIGVATGINIVYERDAAKIVATERTTVDLQGVTVEQALDQVLTINGLWYKVMNPRTIMVIQENLQKRALYEPQVIRTFYVSHARPEDIAQTLKQLLLNVQPVPAIVANKTQNTITVRATERVVNVLEQIIRSNDRPAAEIVIDVEILEVNRTRARRLGINLAQYAIGTIFSPEVAPTVGGDAGTISTPPFNLNTITAGISTADFYLTVPQAIVNFLESDDQTRLLAKPQLRGAEGEELTLNLGDEIPVLNTQFGALAGTGVQSFPVTSYTYRPIGVNVKMTPRVTYENEIILELEVESSALGANILVGGVAVPSFSSRKAKTVLRLREGEANLLASLVREDTRRSLSGVAGLVRVPIFRRLFGTTDDSVAQTDIIMLLTPRIVRTHELTQRDLDPIYVGTQQLLGLTGPPPLIAPPPPEAPQPGVPPGAAPPGAAPQPTAPTPTSPTPQPQPPPVEQPPPPEAQPPQTPPQAEPVPTGARLLVTASGGEFQMGGGPYTVPISISGASRLSTISVSVTFNPAVLRVRSVQPGTFMNQGGINATFSQQVDPGTGRVDITIARAGDAVGASGTGLLAAILFDPAAPGTATLTPAAVATTADGGATTVQVAPASVVVK